MGVFEIIMLAGVLASTIFGIGSILGMPKFGDPQKDGTNFSGPRSSMGDSIPWVFGTQDVTSPICLWAAPITNASPFGYRGRWRQGIPGDSLTDESGLIDFKEDQYAAGLDLLLSRRIHRNGSPHGVVRLLKIWLSQNILWEARGFVVDSSGSLLSHDPNNTGPIGTYPGGVTDEYTVGNGWWHGGMTSDNKDVTGYWGFRRKSDTGEYTEALGLESVYFYTGNGNETSSPFVEINFQREPGFQNYPSYSNLIRLAFCEFWFGYQPSIPEITAQISVSCPAPEIGDNLGWISTQNQFDVNPVSLLYILLTTPKLCGSSKLPEIDIPSFTLARQIIQTEQLGVSYTLRSPMKANELVEIILGHIDGCLYREPVGGKLVLKLFRAEDITNAPVFTEQSVSKISNLSKSSWMSTYGQCRVVFEHRANAANGMAAQNVAVEQDPGLIAQNGAAETLEENAPMATTPEVASQLAARKLSVANSPLLQMNLVFTRLAEGFNSALSLRPGSLFILNYAPLGISNLVCRVLGVDLGTLEDNTIKVSVIQDRYKPAPVITPPKPSNPPPLLPPRPDVTIPQALVITAPYVLAKRNFTGDPRKQLSSAGVYLSPTANNSDYTTPLGSNLDRFLILAKRPERGGFFFSCVISDSTGVIHENLTIPYTICGTLRTSIGASAGGANSTYSQNATSPIVIDGLSQEDINSFSSSFPGYAGKNIMLIGDEWMMFDVWSQTGIDQITITSYHRMLFDSPCVPNTASGIPEHPVTSAVWFFDFTKPDTSLRLSSPYKSNDFKVTVWKPGLGNPVQPYAPWSDDPMGFVEYSSGFGPSGKLYNFSLANIGSTTNNRPLAVSNVVLHDRANRLWPQRRWYYSGGGTTAGYNKTGITISQSAGNFLFRVDGAENLNPRNEGNEIKLFTTSNSFFEENDRSIVSNWDESFVNATLGFNYGAVIVASRIVGHPDPAFSKLRYCAKNGASTGPEVIVPIPVESTSRNIELFIYRCFTGASGEPQGLCHAMLSTPRQLRLTLSRT